MPSLVQGRVVYPTVKVPDPQGNNPKEGRPFVVITGNEDIAKADRVVAIGITGELDESPSDHYVVLKHGLNWVQLRFLQGKQQSYTGKTRFSAIRRPENRPLMPKFGQRLQHETDTSFEKTLKNRASATQAHPVELAAAPV
ncbi:MAG: hypothetical protein K2R98_04175 [Gemmataceae bacterium]|nr:hypothetical protein [Gemmataceae bacterium]